MSVGCSSCTTGNGAEVDAQQPPTEINVNKDLSNPVIIPGVPTEHGSDSGKTVGSCIFHVFSLPFSTFLPGDRSQQWQSECKTSANTASPRKFAANTLSFLTFIGP